MIMLVFMQKIHNPTKPYLVFHTYNGQQLGK